MERLKPTKIHELFARPGTWTQGTFAKDAEGNSVSGSAPAACQWCLMGAMLMLYGAEGQNFIPARNKLRERLSFDDTNDGIFHWNDRADQTQENVRRLCAELDI